MCDGIHALILHDSMVDFGAAVHRESRPWWLKSPRAGARALRRLSEFGAGCCGGGMGLRASKPEGASGFRRLAVAWRG